MTFHSNESSDTMNLEEYLIRNREATFSFEMKGESMREQGILAGDLVIVERGKSSKFKDIVVIEIDGEHKIQKFSELNKNQKVNVVAVVTAIARKYK